MKLEENGRASASKRTRHFNIKHFYVTDLLKREEFQIKYCPTDDMIADYFTKPLVGRKFDELRALVLNLPRRQKASRSVLEVKNVKKKN